jgi:hypothetical protein
MRADMERTYTESEIRRAFIKAMDGGGCWNDVLAELNGHRLKPDCPVMDAAGDVWRWMHRSAGIQPFTPLVRADRVMEWARGFAEKWHSRGDQTLVLHFQRRIREETEVSDG